MYISPANSEAIRNLFKEKPLENTKENTTQILRRMEALLQNPENWTKGVFARASNHDGEIDWYNSNYGNAEHMTCWCISGAIQKVTNLESCATSPYLSPAFALLNALTSTMHGKSLIQFNDDYKTKHKDVLALLKLAIEVSTEKYGDNTPAQGSF